MNANTNAKTPAVEPGKPSAEENNIKSRGETVTVACKVPNGYILQCWQRVNSTEPSPSGAREIEIAQKVGEPITLNGPARPLTGGVSPYPIIGGYGITYNVPKDIWDKWLADNAEADVVKNHQIFAYEKRERAEDRAKDQKSVRSGMEPLDADGRNADKSPRDPRMLRGIKKHDDADMETEASS